MFQYFGRKARIAHLYPRPTRDRIVEPFAGSASYAMHSDNWMRDVVLVEKHPLVAELWRYLISPSTTAETIADLPDVVKGEELPYERADPRRLLISLSSGSENLIKNVASEWMARDWAHQRDRVASEIHKVKHWTLIEGDYWNAPHETATWFVDPPYQKINHGYDSDRSTIDFPLLGEWCQSLPGQVIACEESGADWLPFEALTGRTTINNTSTVEVVWTNTPALTLFDLDVEGAA